jgi:hypothetical protein
LGEPSFKVSADVTDANFEFHNEACFFIQDNWKKIISIL